MKYISLIVLFFLVISYSSYSQSEMVWFEASSNTESQFTKSKALDCVMSKDEEVEGTTLRNIEFKSRQFFVFTQPQVRKYMKDEYMIECMAQVSQVGKNTFLILDYKINSDKAKTNYGNLEKGGKIKVTLGNNNHVYLENIERSRGKVKRSDKYTVYTGTYAINKTNYNILKKQHVDKITVLWEEGVEEYEVQNIDLIRNQLTYLDKL